MALSADRKRAGTDNASGIKYPVASSTTIYSGALVCLNTSGYAIPAADTSSLRFVGVNTGDKVDNSGGDNGDLTVTVQRAHIERGLTSSGLSQSTVGTTVYISDDETVTTAASATNDVACGIHVAYPDTNVADVLIDVYNAGVTPNQANLTVATRAALSALAISTDGLYDGQSAIVLSDYSEWIFDADGTATEDTAQAFIVEPDAGLGQWLRKPGVTNLRIPVTFAATNGLSMCTVPAGFYCRIIGYPTFEVITAWTGGTSSAIGFSTNVSGYETAGDLWGTASGQVEANLASGFNHALGGELNDLTGFLDGLAFPAGSEFQFDRVVDAFTAGSGVLHVPAMISRLGAVT